MKCKYCNKQADYVIVVYSGNNIGIHSLDCGQFHHGRNKVYTCIKCLGTSIILLKFEYIDFKFAGDGVERCTYGDKILEKWKESNLKKF